MPAVLGIHHVTAIASDPQRNLDFYSGFLGLRLVKRTVNFDDPETYHLYFGDEQGTPGSIMTFFPWPGARRGRQGARQVGVTSFAIPNAALGFWLARFLERGVRHEGPGKRGSGATAEQVIAFQDPDGLLLEIVASAGSDGSPSRGESPGIPGEHGIRGFHSVTLWVEEAEASERVLVDTLGFRPLGEDWGVQRFAAGSGGPGTLVNVKAVGGFPEGIGGAGTVHHVAWRAVDDGAQLRLREKVQQAGLRPTPVIDRNYFHSVYFGEPGGVLFEIATDPPGFTIDEPLAHLGEHLMLPRQYESHRQEIEAVLPPIHLPVSLSAATIFASMTGPENVSLEATGFRHRFLPPTAGAEPAGSVTLLLLHGTGGSEEDLIPLGRSLLPGAGLLSPLGKVLENGAPRFFARKSEGVFDQEDLAFRTEELAGFVRAAITSYQLNPEGIIAVGFSNGANIASSLMLRHPGLLRAAVLLSPMVPFIPDPLPDLRGKPVFIGAGRSDPLVPVALTTQLEGLLSTSGAVVTVHWDPGGHGLTEGEIAAARHWLAASVLSP